MKTNYGQKEARLELFSSLYETAKNSYCETLNLYERHMKQYRGGTDIDGSSEPALTVRNITYEIVESQVSSDIPHPKVDAACYSEKKNRNAKAVERLLLSVRDKLPYEELNDVDERYTYVFGGSVWYVEWDNSLRLGKEVGGVRLYCLSPMNFIPQPNICSIDDMEYCFLKFTTTRGELKRKYRVNDEVADCADYEISAESESTEQDTVTVITAFYKDGDGEIGKFVFSGEAVLYDMPKYYRRKIKLCKRCGEGEELCRCRKKSFIDKDQISEILPERIFLSDGSEIPKFSPVIEGGYLSGKEGSFRMKNTEIPYPDFYKPKSEQN